MWLINSKYEDADFYNSLEKEILQLIEGEKNLIANLSNISSWIFHSFPELNWCGFYLYDSNDDELILGPFQGKPACIRIKPGRGVCGKAFTMKAMINVQNVHEFKDHITCDSASLSELVIPLIKDGYCFGVLDLDSPVLNRFSKKDSVGLEKIIARISQKIF